MTSREPWRGQRIGNLREFVTLEEYDASGDDGYGNPVVVWIPHGPLHARVEPVKGVETIIAGGLAAVDTILVHIRYRADVTPAWRLIYGGRTYNVRSVRNLDERRRFTTLECEGGVAT